MKDVIQLLKNYLNGICVVRAILNIQQSTGLLTPKSGHSDRTSINHALIMTKRHDIKWHWPKGSNCILGYWIYIVKRRQNFTH